ncbi:MAG: 16S rRNA (guanine(527)-N(7))-methyltransferase RsmG [Lachnospiraceae bacterium]|nr:16S rRNA (guanine(527)-N(7))-methyltransferase RsmG [Lachnospiraceae bacterium]
MNDYTRLITYLAQYEVSVSDEQIRKLDTYYEMMIETNKSLNLTAITEFEEVLVKHYIDSVSIIRDMDMTKDMSVIDVGTGAGFPGMVLKIIFPSLKITLFDSLQKRLGFLDEVIRALSLTDITTCHGRAEEAGRLPEMREQYDLCVSRAVANLPVLSELCLPFVKVGGKFVSYKSDKGSEEVAASPHALEVLGGSVLKEDIFTLEDNDMVRNLVIIDKIKECPKSYPRKPGTPSKKPL